MLKRTQNRLAIIAAIIGLIEAVIALLPFRRGTDYNRSSRRR